MANAGLVHASASGALTNSLPSRIVASMHARFLVPFLAASGALLAQAPAAPKVPDTVLADREVEYSAVGGRQTMDIVRPRDPSASPRPTVLLVHGGGFRGGTKEGYVAVAVKLAERGYV